MSLESFREETRTWLEENCPESMRTPMPADETPHPGRRATFKNPETKVWLDRMAEKGWTVPLWPKEYGGGSLSIEEAAILQEEMARINARKPLFGGMGTTMIGPALLEYGTEEQKKEHLTNICNGNIWWCQGYSEPNSGSDLASLQTKAVLDGDTGGHRTAVVLNAAAALLVADKAPDWPAAVSLAESTIDSGAAAAALNRLIVSTCG